MSTETGNSDQKVGTWVKPMSELWGFVFIASHVTLHAKDKLHSTSSHYCDDQCSPDLFSLAPVAMFSALVQCHCKPGRQLGKLKYIRIFVSSFLSECHVYYCSCQGTFTHAHDIRYETEIQPFCMSTYIFIRAKSFSCQLNLSCKWAFREYQFNLKKFTPHLK